MINADLLQLAGLRADGRSFTDLRNLRHKIGLFTEADGSAYLEQGLNKVLILVNGPQEPRKSENPTDIGAISVHLAIAAFSGMEWKRRRVNDKKSVELETIIRQTFEGTIMLNLYPRSEINISVHILESDG